MKFQRWMYFIVPIAVPILAAFWLVVITVFCVLYLACGLSALFVHWFCVLAGDCCIDEPAWVERWI